MITTGGETESYCAKCKLKLDHIVVAMVGGAVMKVKCKTCGSTHRLRGMPAVRQEPSKKKGVSSKTSVESPALWEMAVEAAVGIELDYDMALSYRSGDLIAHKVFGKGVVQKTFFKKCSILFRDKERILATSNT